MSTSSNELYYEQSDSSEQECVSDHESEDLYDCSEEEDLEEHQTEQQTQSLIACPAANYLSDFWRKRYVAHGSVGAAELVAAINAGRPALALLDGFQRKYKELSTSWPDFKFEEWMLLPTAIKADIGLSEAAQRMMNRITFTTKLGKVVTIGADMYAITKNAPLTTAVLLALAEEMTPDQRDKCGLSTFESFSTVITACPNVLLDSLVLVRDVEASTSVRVVFKTKSKLKSLGQLPPIVLTAAQANEAMPYGPRATQHYALSLSWKKHLQKWQKAIAGITAPERKVYPVALQAHGAKGDAWSSDAHDAPKMTKPSMLIRIKAHNQILYPGEKGVLTRVPAKIPNVKNSVALINAKRPDKLREATKTLTCQVPAQYDNTASKAAYWHMAIQENLLSGLTAKAKEKGVHVISVGTGKGLSLKSFLALNPAAMVTSVDPEYWTSAQAAKMQKAAGDGVDVKHFPMGLQEALKDKDFNKRVRNEKFMHIVISDAAIGNRDYPKSLTGGNYSSYPAFVDPEGGPRSLHDALCDLLTPRTRQHLVLGAVKFQLPTSNAEYTGEDLEPAATKRFNLLLKAIKPRILAPFRVHEPEFFLLSRPLTKKHKINARHVYSSCHDPMFRANMLRNVPGLSATGPLANSIKAMQLESLKAIAAHSTEGIAAGFTSIDGIQIANMLETSKPVIDIYALPDVDDEDEALDLEDDDSDDSGSESENEEDTVPIFSDEILDHLSEVTERSPDAVRLELEALVLASSATPNQVVVAYDYATGSLTVAADALKNMPELHDYMMDTCGAALTKLGVSIEN